MRRIASLSAFCLAALAITSAASDCSNLPTSGADVVTWTGKCTDLQSPGENCWAPHAPSNTSTVVLPSGANATLSPNGTAPFDIFLVKDLIVQSGALLYVTSGAIQTTGCLVVGGTLALYTESANSQSPKNGSYYLPDPAQPEGTDCAMVFTGFTPRVCGPGRLSVTGTVSVTGLYASLFISGSVEPAGTLSIQGYGFMWGNITNYGTHITSGYYTYQHGFLYNYGVANLSTMAFDVWAQTYNPATAPLLIENHGTLNVLSAQLVPTHAAYMVNGTIGSAGTYTAYLINYGTTVFSMYGLANYGFNVFNYGNMIWGGWMQFNSAGSLVNRGTLTVNSATVFVSQLMSIQGTINLINGGTLNYGSSTSAASATMKLCQLTQGMPSDLKARFLRKSKQRERAARHVGHNEPVIEQRGDCWWYGDFCYHSPYIWSPPVNVDEAMNVERPAAKHASGVHVDRHGGSVRLRVQQLIADSELSADTPCAVRYSLDDTIVTGDGSGSVMANLPVRVTKKLELRAGAKWYVAAERRGAPFYGGGRVVVRRGAKLFAGISADFKHDGTLEVQRGGQLAIPRHASVFVSNHTLLLQPGAQLHVDGKLTIAEAKEGRVSVDQCGQLNGVGEVVMEREGMLGCHTDSRKKKLHHDTLDQHEKKHGAARRH